MASRRRGSNRGRHGSGRGSERRSGAKGDTQDVDESSPVIQAFRGFQAQLDARNDKHERIFKLSRDITIESKRAIFLLHRASGEKENQEKIFEEADEKLREIDANLWRAVASELRGHDPHQFLRAYYGGAQEYIEAVSFYQYLKQRSLITLEEVQTRLTFPVLTDTPTDTPIDGQQDALNGAGNPQSDPVSHVDTGPATNGSEVSGAAGVTPPAYNPADGIDTEKPEKMRKIDDVQKLDEQESSDKTSSEMSEVNAAEQMKVHIPATEYILGLADLTGEIMRLAIGSVSHGDFELPFELCVFMRVMHDAFVSFGNVDRWLRNKLTVLKASMKKVETACYTLQVRGSEVPKHMLADVLRSQPAHHDYTEEHEQLEA